MKSSTFYVGKIKPVFKDHRGEIFDLIEDPISHIGYITFRKGAVRGNHFHKNSTQYTFVFDGKIELFTKDVRKANAPVKKTVMTAGTFACLPPHTIHTYRALTPASMIDCTTVSRRAKGYEHDTTRIDGALMIKSIKPPHAKA